MKKFISISFITFILISNLNAQITKEIQKLSGSNFNLYDKYGVSADISNNYVIIGDTGDDIAYIYKKNNLVWNEIQIISATDNYIERFGSAIAITDSFAVISDYMNSQNGDYSGAVFVFKNNNDNWEQVAKLTASDGSPYNYFGSSVAIYNETIIVGANNESNKYSEGAVYVFDKPENGWTNMHETAKLTALETSNSAEFGFAIDIYEDNIIVGAWNARSYNTKYYEEGAVYVYQKPVTGWTDMTETQKIIPPDVENADCFGYSVSIYGNKFVVGDHGYNQSMSNYGIAYVYEEISSGNWSKIAELTAFNNSNDINFGFSVEISEKTILIGATKNDDTNINNGAIYVFEKPEVGWQDATESLIIIANDAENGDFLGHTVKMCNNYAITTAYELNADFQSNKAYILAPDIPEITTQVENQNICIGNNAIFSLSENYTENFIWQEKTNEFWINLNNNETYSGTTTNELTIINPDFNFNSNQYRCILYNSYDSLISNEVTLTISELTEIINQPISEIIVCENSPQLSVFINANGNNLTYQWYKNNNLINGQTNSYILIATNSENSGNYKCFVSGDCGEFFSNECQITINQQTEIINQLQNFDLCEGSENIILNIEAIGTGVLTFRWFKNYEEIFEANQNTYTITSIVENTGTYICNVSGECGINISSNNSEIFITDIQTEIISQPNSQEVFLYENVIFNISANGSNLNYQWQKNGIDLENINNISGVNTNSLNIYNVDNSNQGNYSCIVSGICGNISSEIAYLSILVGVNNVENNYIITPNPTNGMINFEFVDYNIQQITISDITGKPIIEKINIQQNEMIDLSNFESGIYIIIIQTDNKIFTTKIIKE